MVMLNNSKSVEKGFAPLFLVAEVQSLAYFPDCQGVKKLANHAYSYRLRVGDYRVFFEFDGSVHVIDIEEVKKRDERTY